MQRGATALLAAAAALLVAARIGRGQHPAWKWVGAFAEAALVGGLADWFAVVALFRRPLGLPIWHTAIIPAHKDDIARNLGEFVENHLLTPDALRKEVAEGDVAARLAEALQQRDTADALARWLLHVTPQLLGALDDARLSAWLANAVRDELAKLDLPELSGRAVRHLADTGQHQRVLDAVAGALQRYLVDPEHLDAIATFLAQALNLENALYKTMIKAAAPRATQALAGMLGDLRASDEHPWRAQLDAWVAEWVAALPRADGWRAQLQDWQGGTLNSEGLQRWLLGLWPRLKQRLLLAMADGPEGSPSPLHPDVAQLVQRLGQRLETDPALRQGINRALAHTLARLVERHRGASARFLEAQLARWSPAQMSDRVERAIGRDLQFIRINGTLVGGLVGLLLHGLKQLG
jgi:uncharacterized membrane-anchored protein YjiN (DUF445 family)